MMSEQSIHYLHKGEPVEVSVYEDDGRTVILSCDVPYQGTILQALCALDAGKNYRDSKGEITKAGLTWLAKEAFETDLATE